MPVIRGGMGDQGRPGSGPIRFKTTFTNTIYEAMKMRGWRETNSDADWDFIWAERCAPLLFAYTDLCG